VPASRLEPGGVDVTEVVPSAEVVVPAAGAEGALPGAGAAVVVDVGAAVVAGAAVLPAPGAAVVLGAGAAGAAGLLVVGFAGVAWPNAPAVMIHTPTTVEHNAILLRMLASPLRMRDVCSDCPHTRHAMAPLIPGRLSTVNALGDVERYAS
jgi:hypothetical protein